MGEGTRAPEVRAEVPTRYNDDTSRYRFQSQPPQTRVSLLREEARSARRAILPLAAPCRLSHASAALGHVAEQHGCVAAAVRW
jgi:hypothetical protein